MVDTSNVTRHRDRLNRSHSHGTGVDAGIIDAHVMVLQLREGRTFEPEDIGRHVEAVKSWAQRRAHMIGERVGHAIIVDYDSFTVYHDGEEDRLVIGYKVVYGIRREWECYASMLWERPHSHDDHPHIVAMGVVDLDDILNPPEEKVEPIH